MKSKVQYNKSDLVDHLGIWLWLENENGEIFMQFHNKFGCWTIPLEKSEPGEPLRDAIARAGMEELGIEITKWEIVHEQNDKYLREGKTIHVRGYLVKVIKYWGTVRNVEEDKHSEAGWKNKEFVSSLNNTTDATKALQMYLK